jgi:predicted DNA-binding transcriptional regulator YafY
MAIPRPTTRLLALLELLQARDWIGGAELARRLEVNGRSVRRYIAMLEEIGIPVEAARGRDGGYRLRPGYKLPPLLFTDEEAVALALALQGVPRLGLALSPAAVTGARAKLERVLPLGLRERVRALEGSVALEPGQPIALAEGGLVATLGEAVAHGRRVRLRYRAESGEETERAVDPYGVTRWSLAWYLVGYCHLRVAVRLFRLDRIIAAQPLAEEFTPPPDFDAYAYVVHAMATYPARWTVVATLGLTPEQATTRVPPAVGLLEPNGERVTFRGSFDDLDHVARWLVTLRCPVIVHEPPELRTMLEGLAREVAAMAVPPHSDAAP